MASFREAYKNEDWVGSQDKYDENKLIQADEHNLLSGGLLSTISPVSETVK